MTSLTKICLHWTAGSNKPCDTDLKAYHFLIDSKAYIDQLDRVPFEEQLENYKAAYSKKIKEANPKITKLANTKMDEAIRKKSLMAQQHYL